MKTINIKGKDYIPVNERLKHFREHYPDYALVSEIVQATEEHCVFKASIVRPDGTLVASAHAHEVKADGYINKTSFIENCETSVASADEVNNAIAKDKSPKKKSKPKLTAPQLEAMLQAIKDGKSDVVKDKIKNYTLTKPQSDLIGEALA